MFTLKQAMYYSRQVIICVFIFQCMPIIAQSDINQKIINIATPSWKSWTNHDGSGFYFDLTKAIYQPLGYKVLYSIVPFARAKVFVANSKFDAMFSLYKSQRYKMLTPHYPINNSKVMVMFDNEIHWQGPSSLKNQHVIYPRSYEYPSMIDVDFTPIEVNDSKHGMLMLLKGRAKFFITDADEMAQLQQELDVDVLNFSTKQLYAKNLYMGFSKTDKGKKLVAEFDKRLPELIDDGTMQQLYNKWGLTQNTANTFSTN